MMAQTMSDERLVKNAGGAVRSDRNNADADRTSKDGTALSAEERRAQLRNDWVQELLPKPPELPGFHTCWLSTTNSMDPIYKRMQRGYIPVTSQEVGGFGASSIVQEGEFKGCVSCNEMLLFKVEDQTYQDLMTIFHLDMPLEAERGIYEKVNSGQNYDNSGKRLDVVEGDFNAMGQRPMHAPRF
jgi:hypothetical protein